MEHRAAAKTPHHAEPPDSPSGVPAEAAGRQGMFPFEGSLILRLLNEYYVPVFERLLTPTPFSNRMAAEMFGRPWSEIKPEFWKWRDLERVPEESDQCPWV